MSLIVYYSIINISTLFIFFIDKRLAIKNKWRVEEKTLFFFSLIGGSLGALLGMIAFRHKKNKIYFWLINIVLTIIWVYVLVRVYYGNGLSFR